MSEPRQPPIGVFIMSRIVPRPDNSPANQVSFLTGCCRNNHAIRAARKPFKDGKKAVLVALLYLSAMEIVNNAKHRQLPSRTPRFTTALLISFHDKRMMQ